MKDAPLIPRLMLFGFLWIFLFAAAYVLLDSLGLWTGLPSGIRTGIDLATGAILVLTMFGHLLAASGAVPGGPTSRNS